MQGRGSTVHISRHVGGKSYRCASMFVQTLWRWWSTTYRFLISTAPLNAFLGIPWIWFSLRSLDKDKERRGGGVHWNDLADSKVKLSQSHLLWSTSTWCNHQNAAGKLQSQTDHWQNWGRSAETPHSTNYSHLSLFISQCPSLYSQLLLSCALLTARGR